MNSALAGWLQVALLVVALAACYVPLGNYMAHIFTSDKHWRVERGIYKVIGVDPEADQKWSAYLRSMLAFSAGQRAVPVRDRAAAAPPAAVARAWPTCRRPWPGTPPPRS